MNADSLPDLLARLSQTVTETGQLLKHFSQHFRDTLDQVHQLRAQLARCEAVAAGRDMQR